MTTLQLLDAKLTRLERIVAALAALYACYYGWQVDRAMEELDLALNAP